MSDHPTTPTIADGWAEGRAAAKKAVEILSRSPVAFTGALLLDGGWELHSPDYVASTGRSLSEKRRAEEALDEIIQTARKGLGI
jgi:hypothetical protein